MFIFNDKLWELKLIWIRNKFVLSKKLLDMFWMENLSFSLNWACLWSLNIYVYISSEDLVGQAN